MITCNNLDTPILHHILYQTHGEPTIVKPGELEIYFRIGLVCKKWSAYIFETSCLCPNHIKNKNIKHLQPKCSLFQRLVQLRNLWKNPWIDFVNDLVHGKNVDVVPNKTYINTQDINRQTPLGLAISYHDKFNIDSNSILNAITKLLENGADPNIKTTKFRDNYQNSRLPLFLLSPESLLYRSVSKELIKYGAKLDLFLEELFAHPCKYYFHYYVQLMVDNKFDINRPVKDKCTLLHLLFNPAHCDLNNFPIAFNCLLEAGANVSIPDSNGSYPIHLAVKFLPPNYKLYTTQILEKAPHLAGVKDSEGFTPFYWSVRHGKIDYFKELLKYQKLPQDHLLQHALVNRIHKLCYGTWMRFDPKLWMNSNFSPEHWYPPLFNYLNHDHNNERKKELLDLTKEVLSFLENEKNVKKETLLEEIVEGLEPKRGLLHHLCMVPHDLIFYMEEQSYVKKNVLDSKVQGNLTVRDVLINKLNEFEWVVACIEGNLYRINELPKESIDISICDEEGNSLLHAVVHRLCNGHLPEGKFHSYLKIIDLLLDYNIDPNIKGANGNTPLHIASYNKTCYMQEVIFRLLAYGADPHLKNDTGETSVDLINQHHKPEFIKRLGKL